MLLGCDCTRRTKAPTISAGMALVLASGRWRMVLSTVTDDQLEAGNGDKPAQSAAAVMARDDPRSESLRHRCCYRVCRCSTFPSSRAVTDRAPLTKRWAPSSVKWPSRPPTNRVRPHRWPWRHPTRTSITLIRSTNAMLRQTAATHRRTVAIRQRAQRQRRRPRRPAKPRVLCLVVAARRCPSDRSPSSNSTRASLISSLTIGRRLRRMPTANTTRTCPD